MSTLCQPRKKTTYVVSKGDSAWLSSVQAKLYARAFENTDYIKAFRPSPVRRIMIPKPGKPGKFRPLGIPTVKDRVVQSALRNILEPIFEADFYPTSYGFRPGRSIHGALEHLRKCLNSKEIKKASSKEIPRLTYQVAIEGDIKGCFDNISWHGLMNRIRRRVGDNKVNRLILAFLKAGIVSEAQFMRTEAGTPQGGILTPPTQLNTFPGEAGFCALRFVSGHQMVGKRSNEYSQREHKDCRKLDMRSAWRQSFCAHEANIENRGGIRAYPSGGRASSSGI